MEMLSEHYRTALAVPFRRAAAEADLVWVLGHAAGRYGALQPGWLFEIELVVLNRARYRRRPQGRSD